MAGGTATINNLHIQDLQHVVLRQVFILKIFASLPFAQEVLPVFFISRRIVLQHRPHSGTKLAAFSTLPRRLIDQQARIAFSFM